jgi:hypothetical protein
VFPECRRGVIDLVGIDREGEVLCGPFSLVFLQQQHTGLVARSQEEPRPACIPQTYFQTKHVPIKSFRFGKVFDAERDFVHTTNGQHDVLLTYGPISKEKTLENSIANWIDFVKIFI